MQPLFNLLRIGGLVLAAMLFAAHAAHAQTKTNAGTTVNNTFTLNYSVGGFTQPQIDNTASPTAFTVDRLVDLTVTSLDPAVNVSPNSTGNVVRYRVTNTGNDNVAYQLSTSNGTTTYTPGSVTITYFLDLNNDGILNGAEALQTYTPGNSTVDVAPNQNLVVRVTSNVPPGTADGSFANIRLTADSRFPITSVDPTCTPASCTAGANIVGDADGNSLTGAAENVLIDGAGVTDAANAGDFSSNALLTVVAPALAATKSVVVFSTTPGTDAACQALTSPASGNQYSTPGACVQYVIAVNNTGSGVAANISIADRLPAEVRFLKAELATSTGTGFTDDPAVTGTGPSLAAPGAIESCDGTSNCLVSLADAALNGGRNGQIRIWARVK